eukprot:TRINITY_DN1515_c0_g1_i6.p2 TRINITY_DN1515_c0_g1~~TRINITY_DN1515_c0_g1_i6.p2  ORF type:complete len:151 (+),score=14.90 TRINITY_DN1515_c0_g1_i6:191-643(+)
MMFIKQKEQTMQTKYDSIGVIGALGRNFSQEVGNINLLYHHAPRKIYFMSNHNLVFLLSPGSHTVHLHQEEPKVYCGLLPIGAPSTVTTSGLKWELSSTKLHLGGVVSSSNEIVREQVQITTDAPVLCSLDLNRGSLRKYSKPKTGYTAF